MLVYAEGDTPSLEEEAQAVLFDILLPAYPNHPWSVRSYPNGIFIGYLDFPTNWGMNIPRIATKAYSASALQKLIVMRAGEWLERAHMRRGAGDGDQTIGKVEGVPASEQPPDMKIELAKPDIREES